MKIQDIYRWEAEKKDGTIITSGADLSDCVRFSLISDSIGHQRHDIVGVKMQRRFCRAFVRGLGGGMREYLHCVVCEGFRLYVKSTNGTVLITTKDHEVYL